MTEKDVLVHDAHRDDPTLAFMLANMATRPGLPDADRRVPRRPPPDGRGAHLAAHRRREAKKADAGCARCSPAPTPGRSSSRPRTRPTGRPFALRPRARPAAGALGSRGRLSGAVRARAARARAPVRSARTRSSPARPRGTARRPRSASSQRPSRAREMHAPVERVGSVRRGAERRGERLGGALVPAALVVHVGEVVVRVGVAGPGLEQVQVLAAGGGPERLAPGGVGAAAVEQGAREIEPRREQVGVDLQRRRGTAPPRDRGAPPRARARRGSPAPPRSRARRARPARSASAPRRAGRAAARRCPRRSAPPGTPR